MIKNNVLRKIVFAVHAVIAASPFVLMVYLFQTWVDDGEVRYVSFSYALYYWAGINPAIANVPYDLAGVYKLYVYLLKLPLWLWLFILCAPSFVYVYKNVGE